MSITKISPSVVDFDDGITISTADNLDTLTLTSTDADASVGPILNLYRNSSSPADSDIIGAIDYDGRNDNSQDVLYSRIIGAASDVSDGTEDGALYLQTIVAGTTRDRVSLLPTETIVNDGGIDLDFRVATGNANMFFVDGGNDRVGIGTASPTRQLTIENTLANSGGVIGLTSSDSSTSGTLGIIHYGNSTDSSLASINGIADGATDAGALVFKTEATGASIEERMRIDSSGRVLIGLATADTLYGGIVPVLQVEGTDVNGSSIGMFRNSNDAAGPILTLGKSRGTSLNSDTIVQSGDATGMIAFTGADGGERMRATAAIKSFSDGTPGDNDMPGRLSFWTTPDGGYDEVERVQIQKDGALRMGGSAFGNITGGFNYVTLADDATKTIALSGTATAGGALMVIYEGSSGDNALFHVGYGMCAIVNAHSSYATSDTDGKFCVIVSGHNISFKNRIGASRNFNIMVYGAGNFNYNL